MALQEDKSTQILINSYSNGEILVGEKSYKKSIIIVNNQEITDWPPQSFDELTAEHLEFLMPYQAKLILLGTGEQHHVPHSKLMIPFLRLGIGFEHMSTHAACRTHLALSSVGRHCLTALIIR